MTKTQAILDGFIVLPEGWSSIFTVGILPHTQPHEKRQFFLMYLPFPLLDAQNFLIRLQNTSEFSFLQAIRKKVFLLEDSV